MSECKGCKHDKNRNSRNGFEYCSQCDRAYAGSDRGFHTDRYEDEEQQDTWKQQKMSRFERVE